MERALYAVIRHHQPVGISKSEMAAEVGISLFETFAHITFFMVIHAAATSRYLGEKKLRFKSVSEFFRG
jgi:hypothetical protein